MRPLLFAALFSLVAFSVQAQQPGLDDFVHTYADRVEEQLRCIHQQPMTKEDRFLILEIKRDGENYGYVQCMLHDNDTQIYCEAASGFYNYGKPALSPEALAALRQEGFDTSVTDGNYKLELPFSPPQSYRDMAVRMLRWAHVGYGAHIGGISTFGPFADVCRYLS